MKKLRNIAKEYPLPALFCSIADIIVTIHFTQISHQSDPTAITFLIALYGTVFGVLIFTLGLVRAKEKSDKKAVERRREKRREMIMSMYANEFYSITQYHSR